STLDDRVLVELMLPEGFAVWLDTRDSRHDFTPESLGGPAVRARRSGASCAPFRAPSTPPPRCKPSGCARGSTAVQADGTRFKPPRARRCPLPVGVGGATGLG